MVFRLSFTRVLSPLISWLENPVGVQGEVQGEGEGEADDEGEDKDEAEKHILLCKAVGHCENRVTNFSVNLPIASS